MVQAREKDGEHQTPPSVIICWKMFRSTTFQKSHNHKASLTGNRALCPESGDGTSGQDLGVRGCIPAVRLKNISPHEVNSPL